MKRPDRQGKRAIERKVRQAKGWTNGLKPRTRVQGVVGWITWQRPT